MKKNKDVNSPNISRCISPRGVLQLLPASPEGRLGSNMVPGSGCAFEPIGNTSYNWISGFRISGFRPSHFQNIPAALDSQTLRKHQAQNCCWFNKIHFRLKIRLVLLAEPLLRRCHQWSLTETTRARKSEDGRTRRRRNLPLGKAAIELSRAGSWLEIRYMACSLQHFYKQKAFSRWTERKPGKIGRSWAQCIADRHR